MSNHYAALLASAKSNDPDDRLDNESAVGADHAYAVTFVTQYGGPSEYVTLLWTSQDAYDNGEDPYDGYYHWTWATESEVRYIAPPDAAHIWAAFNRDREE